MNMINKDDYIFLRDRYAHIASWTIWDKAPIGEEKTKRNIGGLEWCSDEEALIQHIHGKYVFVAANPYNKETITKQIEKHESGLIWGSNFHSSWRFANDHKLRYATAGTEMEGCYITDLIKDIQSRDVKSLKEEMKKNPSKLEKDIDIFKEEIVHLSDNPIIIALGNDVYDWLKPLCEEDEYRVFKMHHFSYRFISIDDYKKEALDIINQCRSITE